MLRKIMARGEERKTMFLDVVQELGPGGCKRLWAALDRAWISWACGFESPAV